MYIIIALSAINKQSFARKLQFKSPNGSQVRFIGYIFRTGEMY